MTFVTKTISFAIMAEAPPRRKIAFTPGEIRAFKFHAVLVAALVAAMAVVAPPGIGRVLGALFAIALLPIPPLIIYFLRRRKRDVRNDERRS